MGKQAAAGVQNYLRVSMELFGGGSAPFLIAKTQYVFPAKLKEGRTLEDKEKWKKMKDKTAGRQWGAPPVPVSTSLRRGLEKYHSAFEGLTYLGGAEVFSNWSRPWERGLEAISG